MYTSSENQGIVLSRDCYEKLGGYFEPSTIYTNMTVPKSYETTRKEITGVVNKEEYIHAYRKANENNNDMIYIIVAIAVIVGFVAMFNMGILSFMEKARDIVYTDDSGSYLFVVEKGNRVKRRYVETGVKDSEYTMITKGLEAGEVVVCDLGAADYENQKINPVSEIKE